MKRCVVAGLMLCPILSFAAEIPKKASAPVGEVSVYKNADGRDLKLYVVKPADWKAGDSRPAIVFFHGGGWVGGTPSQFNRASEYFASRGLVCVQVEYRLIAKGEKGPPVSCCRDAKSAMRWVRSHAKDLGVDPARIASAGGSAGGHLAAFVGMVGGVDDPQDDKAVSAKSNAMLLFNPVFDNGPDNGWGRERVGDRYKEFSPAHNIDKDDPPAIVFLGMKDSLIPVSVVERFKDGMRKAGVKCDAFYYDDQPHGFFNKDPWQTKTLIEADKFLASLGWLKGAPALTPPER